MNFRTLHGNRILQAAMDWVDMKGFCCLKSGAIYSHNTLTKLVSVKDLTQLHNIQQYFAFVCDAPRTITLSAYCATLMDSLISQVLRLLHFHHFQFPKEWTTSSPQTIGISTWRPFAIRDPHVLPLDMQHVSCEVTRLFWHDLRFKLESEQLESR